VKSPLPVGRCFPNVNKGACELPPASTAESTGRPRNLFAGGLGMLGEMLRKLARQEHSGWR
jgi:hypothetical protein